MIPEKFICLSSLSVWFDKDTEHAHTLHTSTVMHICLDKLKTYKITEVHLAEIDWISLTTQISGKSSTSSIGRAWLGTLGIIMIRVWISSSFSWKAVRLIKYRKSMSHVQFSFWGFYTSATALHLGIFIIVHHLSSPFYCLSSHFPCLLNMTRLFGGLDDGWLSMCCTPT